MAAESLNRQAGEFARQFARESLRRDRRNPPAIAIGTAFLAGVLAVRVGANAFIAVDVMLRGGVVLLPQVALTHAVFLSGLVAWTAPFRWRLVSSGIGATSFAGRLRCSQRFIRRSRFSASFGRASFVVPFAASIVACILGSDPVLLAMPVVSVLAVVVTARLLDALSVPSDLVSLLQVLGLVLLFAANIDIGPGGSGAVAVLFGREFTVDVGPVLIWCIALVGSPVPAAILALAVTRLLDASRSGIPRRPVLRWYWRLTGGSWIPVYALAVPAALSQQLSAAAHRWIVGGIVAYAVGLLLSVLIRVDLALGFSLNRPLGGSTAVVLRPIVAAHALLTAVPLSVLLVIW